MATGTRLCNWLELVPDCVPTLFRVLPSCAPEMSVLYPVCVLRLNFLIFTLFYFFHKYARGDMISKSVSLAAIVGGAELTRLDAIDSDA